MCTHVFCIVSIIAVMYHSVLEYGVSQSCSTLFDPMYYIAPQAPLTMGFSRQEYWSGYSILLLLLLSRFSRVRLCATPQIAAQYQLANGTEF